MWYNTSEVNEMAFNPKSKEEFLNSLKNIEINRPPAENFIEDFVPVGLSNVYELFLKLKDVPLSTAQFNFLANKVSSNYSENVSNLLHNPITSVQIDQLLELLKQEYLAMVTSNTENHLSEEEQSHLKQIINKQCPEIFLDLIETPVSAEEFKKQKDFVNSAVSNLLEQYYQQTSPHAQQNSNYLSSAIYLIYRELNPELSISISGREKGRKSFNDNATKELNKGIRNILPSNVKTGITLSDMQNHIVSNSENPNNFTDKTNADFSGFTIVLNHIDDALHLDENDPENAELLKLKKQATENLRFLHSVKNYLSINDDFLSQEEYFQIYIELLQHLQDCTYPECTHEIKEGSYSSRLEYAIANYKKNMEANSFAPNATDAETDELRNLIDCLKRRVYDKLQNEMLQVTFPHVLEDPILTDKFKIKGNFVKFVKKENGFCAIYFELVDALGRKTEVQLQSSMRYKETKNGLSTHNDMPNKKVDIKPFFELTNDRNDPDLLNHYLSLLGRTSKKQEEYLKKELKKAEEFMSLSTTTPAEKRNAKIKIQRLQKKIDAIETARANIKIKDEYIEEHDMIDMDKTKKEENAEIINVNGGPIKVYNTQTHKRVTKMPIEQYLPIFAEYLSPASMKVISSAHATAPEAHINKKDLIESFTEILRKGDEITYLSELLIDKLKEILNVKDTNQLSMEEIRSYVEDTTNGYYAPEEKFWDTPNGNSENGNGEYEGSER